MADIQEISLHIDGQIFNVKKDVLCEHSDYFRAMFSGHYVEQEQQDITIDMVDAESMNILLRYMDLGLIDLAEYPLSTIGNLAMAANFLQITELIKQIEYCLDIQISLENWIETMTIAESSSYTKLEQTAAAFGFYSFKNMKPAYIPTIQRLIWYLSHPSLNTISEFDVFEFGYKWIVQTDTGADAFLVILGCLDMTKLTSQDLEEISTLLKDCKTSLAFKVVECLQNVLANKWEIATATLVDNKEVLCEKFTERVYTEVYEIVKESKERLFIYTPIVTVWMLKEAKLEYTTHYMYTFSQEKGFDQWLEVAEKNLWGWNIAAWGPNKLVLVGGEHGRGTGLFVKDIKIYDSLRREWSTQGVELPPRRHSGVVTAGDSLFVVGGVGGFRVVLDTAIIYDLKQRTFRKIANMPDAMQSPAVCSHNGKVYASGQKHIYKYEDLGEVDRWVTVVRAEMRTNRMESFRNYIYCSQNYFSHLYRFNPEMDETLQLITHLSNPAAAFCNLGSRLMVFTRPMCGTSELLSVEEYQGTSSEETPKILWTDSNSNITVNDVAGGLALALSFPVINVPTSQYHKKYMSQYANVTYDK